MYCWISSTWWEHPVRRPGGGGRWGSTANAEDEIVGQVFIFLLAGYETSSSTLAFVCYLLAINPESQQRVQEEMDGFFSWHVSGGHLLASGSLLNCPPGGPPQSLGHRQTCRTCSTHSCPAISAVLCPWIGIMPDHRDFRCSSLHFAVMTQPSRGSLLCSSLSLLNDKEMLIPNSQHCWHWQWSLLCNQ